MGQAVTERTTMKTVDTSRVSTRVKVKLPGPHATLVLFTPSDPQSGRSHFELVRCL